LIEIKILSAAWRGTQHEKDDYYSHCFKNEVVSTAALFDLIELEPILLTYLKIGMRTW
jgi:hypothetical protein